MPPYFQSVTRPSPIRYHHDGPVTRSKPRDRSSPPRTSAQTLTKPAPVLPTPPENVSTCSSLSTTTCSSSSATAPNLAVPSVPSAVGTRIRPPSVPSAALHNSELLVPVLECALHDRMARARARGHAAEIAKPFAADGLTSRRLPHDRTHETGNASPKSVIPHHANERPPVWGSESPTKNANPAVLAGPTPFHALEAPSISPADYLVRLARYSFCSRSVFVTAFIYMDRVAARYPILAPTPLNVHRLMVTSVLLATKNLDDILYDNAHFAKVGGLDLAELNALELDLLHRLNFRLHVSQEDFLMFEQKLTTSALLTSDMAYKNLRHSLTKLGFIPVVEFPSSPQSITTVDFSNDHSDRNGATHATYRYSS